MILSSELSITLLVTTRGRIQALQRLLESLRNQSFTQFIVLLGDQNTPGFLDPMLQNFTDISIQRVMLPEVSLSKARNLLLPFVRQGIFAITDDDCYYAPDTLQKIIFFFSTTPKCSVLIGNPNATLRSTLHTENIYSVWRDAPSWVLFFRFEVTHLIGTFDETLGIGSPGPFQSGEETDYLIRALQQGLTVMRESSIAVYHEPVNYSSSTLIKKTLAYSLGRMYLLKKHNFPLWFKLANVLYPLVMLPLDAIRQGKHTARYRWAMFTGRLQGLFL